MSYKSLHVPSKNLKRQGGLKRSDNSLLHTELWRCVIGSFEMFQGGIATCNSKSQPQVELYAYLPPDPSDPVVNGDMIRTLIILCVHLFDTRRYEINPCFQHIFMLYEKKDSFYVIDVITLNVRREKLVRNCPFLLHLKAIILYLFKIYMMRK